MRPKEERKNPDLRSRALYVQVSNSLSRQTELFLGGDSNPYRIKSEKRIIPEVFATSPHSSLSSRSQIGPMLISTKKERLSSQTPVFLDLVDFKIEYRKNESRVPEKGM